MRITIVQGAFLPVPAIMGGAVEKVWEALGAEFARRGHRVVHVSRRHPDLPRNETRDGVEHMRVAGYDAPQSLWRLKWRDLRYSLRVRRMLPAADLLVTNTFWLPILVRSARPGRLYVHVARYPKGQMRFYAHAARLQTVSAPIATAIRAEVPGAADKVCVIPYPLPDAMLHARADDEASREKVILFVGRIHPEKGIGVLIDAMRRLDARERAEWKLRIVGPCEARHGGGGEEYRRALQQRASSLGAELEWCGPEFDTARLRAHYERAALFVYPSLAERGETFGLAPLEAMAAGCPPLVSDLACFREFLEPGKTGEVFDHRAADPAAALAEKIRTLLTQPERLAALRPRAIARARDFSVAHIAQRYLADFAALSA